jgi:HEAT repeat protein
MPMLTMTPAKLKTEEKIEALRRCVEQGSHAEAIACLKKALKEKSNFLVAKAAEFTAQQLAYDLVSDLITAFERFLVDPLSADKTCAGKRAIARALYDLEYDNAAFYRRYLHYRQMEPVYGGHVDTAIDLRCTCALGLIASNDPRAVLSLVALLHDNEFQARLGAVKALELVYPFHAEIVLRHKILQGDEEPEVIAQCFSSLVKAAAEESLSFIAAYLDDDNNVLRESAALALGESRLDDALELLINTCDALLPSDPLIQSFFRAIALQRKQTAYQYLLDKIAHAPVTQANNAVIALSMYNYNKDLKEQVILLSRKRAAKELSGVVESYWKD